MKNFFILLLMLCASVSAVSAQRTSISGAEATGTFRLYFDAASKGKGNYNEVKISALGKGKLKVSLSLTYPYIDGRGQPSANFGDAEGTAEITGDTAVFSPEGTETCKITIKFVKAGQIKITEDGGDGGCGFGRNVYADGTYIKVNKKRGN